MATFVPESLTLLVKTRNEIYQGQFDGKDAIFKYTNDITIEPEILKVVGKPALYCAMKHVTSPLGKEFELLIIQECISGITLHDKSSLAQFEYDTKRYCGAKIVDIDDLPEHVKKPLLIQIIHELERIENMGIEYLDCIQSNVIISEDWLEGNIGAIHIIDFDQSQFKHTLSHEGLITETFLRDSICRVLKIDKTRLPFKMFRSPFEVPYQEFIDFINDKM